MNIRRKLLSKFLEFSHGIFSPLPLAYRVPWLWLVDPPTLLWAMIYRTLFPWYFEPPTHGILTPTMHGISNPLPIIS
jgi:hypothetical protein